MRLSYTAANSLLWYYHDTKEDHLVLEAIGELQSLEVKKSASPSQRVTAALHLLNKVRVPREPVASSA